MLHAHKLKIFQPLSISLIALRRLRKPIRQVAPVKFRKFMLYSHFDTKNPVTHLNAGNMLKTYQRVVRRLRVIKMFGPYFMDITTDMFHFNFSSWHHRASEAKEIKYLITDNGK